MSTESDARKDATLNGRDRREEIKAEWVALKMEPRIQSPAELRRVLMTWDKKSLVEMAIRDMSDAIKANHDKLTAWAEAQEVRTNRLILPRETKAHALGHSDPFNAWLINQKGQMMDAKVVFLEGWKAHKRASEAVDDRAALPTPEGEQP